MKEQLPGTGHQGADTLAHAKQDERNHMTTTIEMPEGGSDEGPTIETGGPVLTETIEALRGGDPPMSQDEIDVSVADASRLLQKATRAYGLKFSPTNVGAGGTGTVGPMEPAEETGPLGLIFGQVQSGKTRAMVFSAAMAIDNGFPLVVILTSDNVKLVEQTAERFEPLRSAGVYGIDSLQKDWELDVDHIRRSLQGAGLVIVCSKNKDNLDALRSLIPRIDGDRHPVLIFDDEGDQATQDVNQARRSRRPEAHIPPSRIHGQTISSESDPQFGDSIRRLLRHSVYVLVTATPQCVCIQHVEQRPDFTHLLKPGDGYLGGEFFFEEKKVEGEECPLRFVDIRESELLHDPNVSEVPAGLGAAVDVFCLSAAIRRVRFGQLETYTFLCQSSHRQGDHKEANRLIRSAVDSLGADFAAGSLDRLDAARVELQRSTTITDDEYDRAKLALKSLLSSRQVVVVNSQRGNKLKLRKGLNFVTGGNILGRGLTLPLLLTTYYLRSAQSPQQDTMWQQARMFGYRKDIEELIRVFIPDRLADLFSKILEADRFLRSECDEKGSLKETVAIQTAGRLRPTRRGVIPVNDISTIRGGRVMHPHYPEYRRSVLGGATGRVDGILKAQVFHGPLDLSLTGRKLHSVPMAVIVELLKKTLVRTGEIEEEMWPITPIAAILQDAESPSNGRLWIRESDRRNKGQDGSIPGTGRIGTGMHGRAVDAEALDSPDPVLLLFRSEGRVEDGWDGVPFWYPTVKIPGDRLWMYNRQ